MDQHTPIDQTATQTDTTHNDAIDQAAIARAVAAELGADVAAETDKRLDPEFEGERAFGLGEVATFASLIIGATSLALQLYDRGMNRDQFLSKLESHEDLPRPSKVTTDKLREILARIVDKVIGTR